jgi:protoporphyrin/coproporphyrin ferrochelatase
VTEKFGAKQAVLLLAHGTPETVEQIPEYLRNVVSGRPMPQHVIEEIQHRYSLIGRSPLTEITLEQARLVEAELARQGSPVRVYVGMRNWKPYIPDVVRQMRADGVEEAAVICLAPQNSRTSVGLYRRAVLAEAGVAEAGAAGSGGLKIDFTESWAEHPLLAEAFAERLRAAEARMTAETGGPVPVLFTAHSVPVRTVQPPAESEGGPKHWPGEGAGSSPDPYAEDARKTAELVAERVEGIPRWLFAFQSQGASGGAWLGPTVEETLDGLATQSIRNLILQPIGFLCDHVEILYDVDIAFREYAFRKGIRLERPESLNGSETLARAIAELAMKGLERLKVRLAV